MRSHRYETPDLGGDISWADAAIHSITTSWFALGGNVPGKAGIISRFCRGEAKRLAGRQVDNFEGDRAERRPVIIAVRVLAGDFDRQRISADGADWNDHFQGRDISPRGEICRYGGSAPQFNGIGRGAGVKGGPFDRHHGPRLASRRVEDIDPRLDGDAPLDRTARGDDFNLPDRIIPGHSDGRAEFVRDADLDLVVLPPVDEVIG